MATSQPNEEPHHHTALAIYTQLHYHNRHYFQVLLILLRQRKADLKLYIFLDLNQLINLSHILIQIIINNFIMSINHTTNINYLHIKYKNFNNQPNYI